MIIGLRWGNVVGSFLREDLSEVCVFGWERDFRFCLFGDNGKFGCHGKFGNKWGVWEEAFTITSEDSVDLAIVQGVLEVLVLHVVVEVVIKMGVIDGVYIDVAMDAR